MACIDHVTPVDQPRPGQITNQVSVDSTLTVLTGKKASREGMTTTDVLQAVPTLSHQDAQRMYDYVGEHHLVPATPDFAVMASSVEAKFGEAPSRHLDTLGSIADLDATLDKFVTMPSGARLEAFQREAATPRAADDLPWSTSDETTPSVTQTASRPNGLMAQAASLLQDPEVAAIVAAGIEMALDERRLTARYSPESVLSAQNLQAALESRDTER
jgi:hypothetical protein